MGPFNACAFMKAIIIFHEYNAMTPLKSLASQSFSDDNVFQENHGMDFTKVA